MSVVPADWIVPDWPAPPGVRALCTTRAGGVSAPPYDGFNLGDHVGDAPHAVIENRRRYAEASEARPVFMTQVHGTRVVAIAHETADGIEADACHTAARGAACTIMVADCLPILFADRGGRQVAAAHAGWRGLATGVVESVVASFDGSALVAWLGPCIGATAFEVGDDVRNVFVAGDHAAGRCFAPTGTPGKWLADLQALARRRLQAAGVDDIHGNDGSPAWCTFNNPLRFFSHRRDRVGGRFAASVWLA